MKPLLDKLKNSEGLQKLLLVTLIVLLLALLFWRIGFGLWLIVMTILWAAFLFIFFRAILRVFWYVLVIFSVFFVFNIVLIFTAATNNSSTGSSGRKLVSCTSSAGAPLQKVSGWDTYLFPANWTGEHTPQPTDKSTQKASYSLATIGKQGAANIFYYIRKNDGSYLPTDTKRVIEICDKNNQTYQYWTTNTTTTTGASEGVVGSESYMQTYGVNEKSVPGTFRVDAYLFTNGTWYLTDRIDSVNFVQ